MGNRRGGVIEYTGTLKMESCCNCGIWFAMPADLMRVLRAKTGKTFYCPMGHPQHYVGESDADKAKRLQDELRAAKATRAQMEQQRNYAQERAERLKRSRAAVRGQLTKTKRRVGNGVCPCCNRSFKDLAAHMATKHPDYAEAPDA